MPSGGGKQIVVVKLKRSSLDAGNRTEIGKKTVYGIIAAVSLENHDVMLVKLSRDLPGEKHPNINMSEYSRFVGIAEGIL